MNKPDVKLKTTYKIFYLSEDGLLKVPKDTWGDRQFFSSSYDTMEEAQEDIRQRGSLWREYIILPSYSPQQD